MDIVHGILHDCVHSNVECGVGSPAVQTLGLEDFFLLKLFSVLKC